MHKYPIVSAFDYTAIIFTVASTPTQSAFGFTSAKPALTAKIMFDFVASSPFEVSVTEGDVITLLEEDDGTGWVKIDDGKGGKGLVPATYLQKDSGGASQVKDVKSPVSPNMSKTISQGSGKYGKSNRCLSTPPNKLCSCQVRGLYSYSAQGDDEISIIMGGRIELTPLGDQYGDGWSEGIDSQGRKAC